MELLFHIVLKRWIQQDFGILKTNQLVKEDPFTEVLYIGNCLTCPLNEATLWDIIH